jgi:hypothetical protein
LKKEKKHYKKINLPMIKIFRKIRQNLIAEGKTTKYFKYAIGEIILVVIGILIALQLNNWNQNQGINKQIKNYKISILSEIQNDLEELHRIDSLNLSSIANIKAYFSYYNSMLVNIDTLNLKANQVDFSYNTFHSNMYSIDELIASGNISLFVQNEKLAMIKLKKQIELYTFYEKEALKTMQIGDSKKSDLQDLAFLGGQTLSENPTVQKSRSTIDSEYYRSFNNQLSAALNYFKYQDYIYSKRIRPQLLELKKVVSETDYK